MSEFISPKTLSLFGQPGRVVAHVESIDTNSSSDMDIQILPVEAGDLSLDKANTITSLARPGGYTHYPVIDIDLPIYALPSTTPGHSHLYIGKQVTTDQLFQLLDVMAEIGLVEPGYVEASRERGFTAVRLPWIPKPVWEDEEILGLSDFSPSTPTPDPGEGEWRECSLCRGHGTIARPRTDIIDFSHTPRSCIACGGTGRQGAPSVTPGISIL